jgi:hypothetical protein
MPCALDWPLDVAVAKADEGELTAFLDGKQRECGNAVALADTVRQEMHPLRGGLLRNLASCHRILKTMSAKDEETRARERALLLALGTFRIHRRREMLIKYDSWLHDLEQRTNKALGIELQDPATARLTKTAIVEQAKDFVGRSEGCRLLVYGKRLKDYQGQQREKLDELHLKIDFAFELAATRNAQQAAGKGRRAARLARADYRRLIAAGSKVGWQKKAIGASLRPCAPRSLALTLTGAAALSGVVIVAIRGSTPLQSPGPVMKEE